MAKTLVLVLATATAFAPSYAPRRRGLRVASSAVEDEAALLNFYTLKADPDALKDAKTPLVAVRASKVPAGGRGVFATRNIERGSTITEYSGLLIEQSETQSDMIETMESWWGARWRENNGRYEIGLSSTAVVDAAGPVTGVDELRGAAQCDVSDGTLAACVNRQGYRDFVILGKVDASPAEGVAQLINDHSAISAPPHPTADGATFSPDDLEPFTVRSNAWPYPAVTADKFALMTAVKLYIGNIAEKNNVALVQAASVDDECDVDNPTSCAPRVFAVATRDIKKGEELYYSYGVEWWLQQLRRAALAQLVSCNPPKEERAALVELMGALESVSKVALEEQTVEIAKAGCMPPEFVSQLGPLPLDDILNSDDDSWQRTLLKEELALATECPVERLYADSFIPGAMMQGEDLR